MRRTILLTALAALSIVHTNLNGQCDTLRHNNTWFDGWISCEGSANPNMAHDAGHWILYDFGQQYTLFEMHVWNTNAPDLLDYGMQNVIIDISNDGDSWVEFGQYVIPQSSGDSHYEGVELMTFDSTNARFVLITAIDNYGGTCYGLSEVRIHARDLCRENRIVWIGGTGDWDIPANWCNNLVPDEFDQVTIPSDAVVTIPYLYTAHVAHIIVEPGAELNMVGNLVVHKED